MNFPIGSKVKMLDSHIEFYNYAKQYKNKIFIVEPYSSRNQASAMYDQNHPIINYPDGGFDSARSNIFEKIVSVKRGDAGQLI